MRPARRVTPNQRQRAQDINSLADAIGILQRIHVGPGLELRLTSTGLTISLKERASGGGWSPDCDEDRKTLGQTQATQDTDIYDPEPDSPDEGLGLQMQVITDIKYQSDDSQPDFAQLTFRTRTIKFPPGVVCEVSAESSLVVVTEAVPCP
jgi:hypothetical protein